MDKSGEFAIAPAATVLPKVREAWQGLLRSQPQALPFQTPEWVDAYLQHWPADAGTLQLVTVRRAGALVAVLPLLLQQRRFGPIGFRLASLLCNPHMPLADITARREDAALWPALLDWLFGASGLRCARLDLPGVARDATLGAWMAAQPQPRQRSVPSSEAARIDTRGDHESLMKAVSSKHRSNLSRSTKRAEAIGPLRYEVFEGAASIDRGWPLLLEIEASGWKGRAGTAIGNDEMLQRFYRSAIEGLGSSGHCRIGVLWFGERPAAAGLLLTAGRTVYVHKLGYREEWAAMGPGHLLMREVVQRACADPALDEVSLVLHPPWSDVWRPALTPVEHHSLYAPGLLGRLLWQVTARRQRGTATAAQPQLPGSPPAPANA